jgi:hypothetical protein
MVIAEIANVAKKSAIFATIIVQKTLRYPMDENQFQLTRKLVPRSSAINIAPAARTKATTAVALDDKLHLGAAPWTFRPAAEDVAS